jgi:hypothetical protein
MRSVIVFSEKMAVNVPSKLWKARMAKEKFPPNSTGVFNSKKVAADGHRQQKGGMRDSDATTRT